MKLSLIKLFSTMAIAISIAGCGASILLSSTGIGGSGFISFGTITGFGSVYVNGVKFETDSSTFDIEGTSGTQSDLAIGMIVQVNGTINNDGVTGTATNISFDDDLQGPVTSLTAPDADGITRSFTTLGVNVIINSSSTTFDLSDNVPANTVFNFTTIVDNNNVEISGFFDASGNLVATRLELKNTVFDANSIVEVKGIITNLAGSMFNIGSFIVDASAAAIEDLPNGLVNGQTVEVKGTLNNITITANRVEGEDNIVNDTDEIELEGIITNYVGDSNFKINGISVDASSATFEPASLSLGNDTRIEAEGAIINGILIADTIELGDGEIKVHANVTSIDTFTNTFEVSPLIGQTITVTVTSSTQIEDDVNSISPFTLNNLVVTNFVEIRGYDDGSGGITATEIDIKAQSDVIVQGNATNATGDAASGGTITVLGILFSFDAVTDFENSDDINLSLGEIDSLINSISAITPQLLKIEDNEAGTGGNTVGVADEIDIE